MVCRTGPSCRAIRSSSSSRRRASRSGRPSIGSDRSGQQRVEADVVTAGQMRRDNLVSQRQILAAGSWVSFPPAASDGRHPARTAGSGVLPADGVHVGPACEHPSKQGDFRLGWGAGIHHPGCNMQQLRLRWPGWPRLSRRQMNQPLKPGVPRPKSPHLLTQLIQLVLQRRRHTVMLAARSPHGHTRSLKSAHVGPWAALARPPWRPGKRLMLSGVAAVCVPAAPSP